MRRSQLVVTFALVALAACGDNIKPPVPDGGTGTGPVEKVCAVLPESATTCSVTAGGPITLLKGNVLTASTVYKGGQVAVDATGKISCVGCDCAVGGETTITCPDASISPGLINTHDHITFDQNPPYTDTGERYEDRQQWRKALDNHHDIPTNSGANADQIRWAELRFLMGGATSIVGSGGVAGLLRNLDQAANEEGLAKKEVEFQTFPLDDTNGKRRVGDCNYGGTGGGTTGPDTAAKPSVAAADAYEPHTSEGIDATARNEFLCETSTTYDAAMPDTSNNLLLGKTAMIHGIGLLASDYGAMAAAKTSLIWSPRSNITLYGDTARVTTAARLGVRIALGTDWLPSGSMNLLRELACADSFNAKYLEHYFRDDQLWLMVTGNAAGVTATDDVIGSLAVGKVADISIFAAHGKAPFRAVLEAEPKDVALVMRGGKTLYGDDGVVAALADTCDTVDVCGTGKRVCLMGEVGKTYTALQTAVQPKTGQAYPAFACGVPQNEPTCVPQRPVSVAGSTIYTGAPTAADSDGDGVPDATDNCPHTFNPIRPLDNGVQGDADKDGVGDACDPCPLDAKTTSCTDVSLADRDHDVAANAADNCPETTNPDQVDSDHDGKGDACDLCPMAANPGAEGCPTTIYAIKGGMIAPSYNVRLTNALVTGIGSNGFFVQVKETDTGYTGPDNSGLFVFTSTLPPVTVAVGARVTLEGAIAVFGGETELVVDYPASITAAAGAPEAAPAPIAVSYSDIKTGGARAAALEGVIVTVGQATVTATNPGSGELTLDDGATNTLVVDDFVSPFAALPLAKQGYTSVTGILALRQNASKLEQRGAADLVLGRPGIASFSPAKSFARIAAVPAAAVTFPQPLTVTLTGPAKGTTITLVSGTPASLTVVDVVVPDGTIIVPIPVTALLADPDVVLTATVQTQTLGPQAATSHVQVLTDVAAPATVTLTGGATIHPNETLTYTATLDIPALVDVTVPISVTPANAGVLTPPASLVIAANQQAATFTFKNNLATGTFDLKAVFGNTSTLTVTVTSAPSHLVISQVYGGGGNSGATLKNDFIELHNPTPAAIALNGLSVQYTSAAGTTWQVTALPDLMVPAGGFVLVGEAAGTGGTVDLPTPDVVGVIPMGGTAGKIALVSNATALAGACPTGLIDLVGYGATTCHEGAAATPAPSNTTGVLRALAGCQDTDDNGADFTAVPPVPRNSATAVVSCQ